MACVGEARGDCIDLSTGVLVFLSLYIQLENIGKSFSTHEFFSIADALSLIEI